ncbi:MAG: hypothetical protein PHE25_06415 [Candidatus Gracilibacteria bacterium]|nr:hypothetical protein [Candidatus Gracilibacteria bacterium]
MFQNEKIIEIKTCKQCNSSFEITDRDLEFYEKVSPIFGGKKYLISPPTLCPDCRQQRRLCFINVGNLYKSGNIVSPYSPDKLYNVVSQKNWFSLKIDGKDFGIDFDFNKSFFTQFNELQKIAPRWDRISENCENCEWSLNIANSKNCYLVKSSIGCENCYYSSELRGENYYLLDCYKINNGNIGYEVISSNSFSNIFWSEKVENCNYGIFLYECENCNYCIGCVGLKNKKYFVLNKEVSKNEYENIYNKIFINKIFKNDLLNRFNILKNSYPRLSLKLLNNQDCIGDEIYNSKNIFNGFFVNNSSDCKFIDSCSECNFCCDSSQPDFVEKCYELSSTYKIYNSSFCFNTLDANNCYYCETCGYIENCFGCVGLNRAKYCILNKQYSKEEYETLVPKIIEHMISTGEWGEFFPSSISPFGYNETIAQEYFPISRDKALPYLYNWSTYEPPFPKVDKIIPANKLPEDITQIPDDILNRAIECEITKKPFRIIKQELEFYRKHNLPIPKRHPDQRHLDRMSLRNPRKLFARICDKCGKDIKTTYSPKRPEIVYCEECYNKEVY